MTRREKDFDALLRRPPETTDDLPLFGGATRGNLGRVQPRLHHGIESCQDEEERQRAVIRGRAGTILNILIAQGPRTRRELADELGIEISCVTAPVDGLRREGFVVETGERRPKGGRLLMATPGRSAAA